MGQSLTFDGTRYNGTFWSTVKPPYFEDDGLVGYWDLSETTGTLAYDKCDIYNNTGIGTGIWGSGGFGPIVGSQCIRFGSGEQTNFGTNDFAISFWAIIGTGALSFNGLVTKGDINNSSTPGMNGFVYGYNSSRIPQFRIINGQGAWTKTINFPSAPNSVWHNYILNVNRSATMSAYFDGTLYGTIGIGDKAGTTLTSTYTTFAGEPLYGRPPINSYIKELKFFNRILTAIEIQNQQSLTPIQYTLNNQWGSRLIENTARVRGLGGIATVNLNSVATITFPTEYFNQIPIIDVCQQFVWGNPQTQYGFKSPIALSQHWNPVTSNLMNLFATNTNSFVEYMQVPRGVFVTRITATSFCIELGDKFPLAQCLVGWHAFGI